MKTLEIIYWLRLALGITAAFICIGYGLATATISKESFTLNSFITGFSIALTTYLMSYYLIKLKFSLKVEKQQKLVTTGIGIFFVSWIVFWTLLYTIIAETLIS